MLWEDATAKLAGMGYNVRDHIGTRTTVRHVYGAYRLPDGLNEGDEVTLVDFQPGYWQVERNGQRYRVAMSGVGDAGRLPAVEKRLGRPGCKPRFREVQGRDFPER